MIGSTGTDIYIIEKTVHKENIGKQILCPDCGKHFQSKSRLIQHLGSHKLNIAEDAHEILSCTDSADCKYKTTSKVYLRDHKRRMHIAHSISHTRPMDVLCRSSKIFFEPSPASKTSARPCKREMSRLQQIICC